MKKVKNDRAKRALRKVARFILAEPKKYNQEHYCGTACCIGGHIAIMFGKRIDGSLFEFEGKEYSIPDLGMKILGKKIVNHSQLFDATPGIWGWKAGYAEKWEKARTRAQKAQVAHDYIMKYVIPTYYE